MLYLYTAMILFVVCVIAIIIYDVNRFVVRNYTIKSPKLTKELRVLLLSDLHCKEYGEGNAKLLQKIREQNADFIFIAGDMINANPGKDLEPGLSFVEKLAKEYDVTYEYGNHEYRLELYPETYGDMWQRFSNRVKTMPLTVLRNEKRRMGDYNISVYGLEIKREYYKRLQKNVMDENYMESVLGTNESSEFSILLAHNPDYFSDYEKWGADLVLSGHVHGGIARIPLLGGVIAPSLWLFPKYDGGEFQKGNSRLILSRGLGSHTLSIRFLNPGELVVIDLKPEIP